MNEHVCITPETLSKLQEAVAQAAASRSKAPEQGAVATSEKGSEVAVACQDAGTGTVPPDGAGKAADADALTRQSSSNAATQSKSHGSEDQQSKDKTLSKYVPKQSSRQGSPPAAAAATPASEQDGTAHERSSLARSQPPAATQPSGPTQEVARILLNAVVSSVPPAQANEAVSSLLSIIQTDPVQGQAALSGLVAALGGAQVGPALTAALESAKQMPASPPTSSPNAASTADALALQSLQRMANERLQASKKQKPSHTLPSSSQPPPSPSHKACTPPPQDSEMHGASPTGKAMPPFSTAPPAHPDGASPTGTQRSCPPSSSTQATPPAGAAAAHNPIRRTGGQQHTPSGRSGAAAIPSTSGSEVLKRPLSSPSKTPESPAHKKSTGLHDVLSRRSGAPARTPTPPAARPAGTQKSASAPEAAPLPMLHGRQAQPRRSRRMSDGGIAAMPEPRAPEVSTGDHYILLASTMLIFRSPCALLQDRVRRAC